MVRRGRAAVRRCPARVLRSLPGGPPCPGFPSAAGDGASPSPARGHIPGTPPGWLGWPVRRRRPRSGQGLVGPVSGPAVRVTAHRGTRRQLQGDWGDWILVDVDPSGSKIITTPHQGGPILVRSFPSLEIVRSVVPPPGEYWDFNAFFAGNMIVSALKGQEERFRCHRPARQDRGPRPVRGHSPCPCRPRHVAGNHPNHDPAPQDATQRRRDPRPNGPVVSQGPTNPTAKTAGILAPEQPLPTAIS
jgi:hypothetical protein